MNLNFNINYKIINSMHVWTLFISIVISIVVFIISILIYNEIQQRNIITKSNRITNGNSTNTLNQLTSISSGSGGSGGRRPPKRNWRKKLKEHLLRHQKSYGVLGILILSGLEYSYGTDLDFINLKNLINEVKDNNELEECLNSFLNNHFDNVSYYKDLIENLDLRLSLASNILVLDSIKLLTFYELDNNSNSSLFIRSFLYALNNTLDSKDLKEIRTNLQLSMIEFTRKSFLDSFSNSSNSLELYNILKHIKVLSNPLSYDHFKFFKQFYDSYILDLGIINNNIVKHFNLHNNKMHSNPVLNMAILVYNSDLKAGLMSSTELNSDDIYSLIMIETIGVLHGFHLDKPIDFIVKDSNEMLELINSLFIQGLRNFYYYKKLHNPLFNIQLNEEDYKEFYNFYTTLANKYNKFGGDDFMKRIDYDFFNFYSLIISLEYEDAFKELNDQLMRDFPDGKMPTIMKDPEDLQRKLKAVNEMPSYQRRRRI